MIRQNVGPTLKRRLLTFVLILVGTVVVLGALTHKEEAVLLPAYSSINNVRYIRWMAKGQYREAVVFSKEEEDIIIDWLYRSYKISGLYKN